MQTSCKSVLDARGVVDLHGSVFLAAGVSGAGRRPGGLGLALRGFSAMQQATQRTWGGKERNPGVGSAMPVRRRVQTAGALLYLLSGCGLLRPRCMAQGAPPRTFLFPADSHTSRPVLGKPKPRIRRAAFGGCIQRSGRVLQSSGQLLTEPGFIKCQPELPG